MKAYLSARHGKCLRVKRSPLRDRERRLSGAGATGSLCSCRRHRHVVWFAVVQLVKQGQARVKEHVLMCREYPGEVALHKKCNLF